MKLKSTNFVIAAVLTIFIFSLAGAGTIEPQKPSMTLEERKAFKDLQDRGIVLDTEDYCLSTYLNTTDDWITNVTFGDINNNSGQEGSDSYGDYTHLYTYVEPEQTYTLYVTFYSEGIWTEHVRVWIDWNQDEIFGSDESYYLGSGVDATLAYDITVPQDADYGETRLRVIEQYYIDPGEGGACGPHSTIYGETEDYTVIVGSPLDHDVSPHAFISPGDLGRVGDPITPEVTFRNRYGGQYSETFDVRLIIELNSAELYNETETITDLPVDGYEDITFPDFTPDEEGVYILTASTELSGDENPDNDEIDHSYQVFSRIVYYDFESSGVFESSDSIWEWGTPTSGPAEAHSGVNLWATILDGDYPPDALTLLTTPAFGLSSNNPVLGFWHWYQTVDCVEDGGYMWGLVGGNVKISTNEGATWQVIVPDGGYDAIAWYTNPLGDPDYPPNGEQIFSGHEGQMWQFETFDLSAYIGMLVMFRFDFGIPFWSSYGFPGWYVDDFTLMGGGGIEPGWVTGVVTNNSSGDPIEGAIVQTGVNSDETGPDGVYTLELFPGTYSITASAEYYNSLAVPGVVVEVGQTTEQDFALTAPMMEMDDSPIDVQMNHGEIQTVCREIINTGDGELEYNISVVYEDPQMNTREPSFADEPVIGQADQSVIEAKNAVLADESAIALNGNSNGEPPVILDFGDEVAYFNLQGECGDFQLLGAVFALDHFWVSGGNSGDDPNYLYQFDRNGSLVDMHEQGTSGWGWLDLTWDGQYIYGTDFDTDIISQFDPATGEVVGTVPNPTAAGLGIAYDPATDHFWGINWFGSNIKEFDRDGNVISSYPQAPLSSAFGIAWDDVSPDGPWLWVFAQETGAELTVAQFDPINGCMTGVQFMAIDHNNGDDLAAGLGFTAEWDPDFGLLLCLGQGGASGANDWLGLYELAETANWLQIDPITGTIAPGESEDVEFTFDMNEVPDTVLFLSATIDVTSNSPVNVSIDVSVDLTSGIEGSEGYLPTNFTLEQNYPNPFNARTEIKYALPVDSDVELDIYNVLGQKVETLVDENQPAGYHRVAWNAKDKSSGMYFYKIRAGDYVETKKMLLLK